MGFEIRGDQGQRPRAKRYHADDVVKKKKKRMMGDGEAKSLVSEQVAEQKRRTDGPSDLHSRKDLCEAVEEAPNRA